MIAAVFLAALFAFPIGFSVLWGNPRRLSNQAFAVFAAVVGVGIGCVFQTIRSTAAAAQGLPVDPRPWTIANNMIAAMVPLAFWILKEAILDSTDRRGIAKRSIPWAVFCAGLAALPFTESFIIPPTASSAWHERGLTYFIFSAGELLAYAIIFVQAWRELPRTSGITRLELQFFVLNIGAGFFGAVALNMAGSYLHHGVLKQSGFILILLAFAISTWAITFRRVFNAREILASLLQRGTLVGGAIAIFDVGMELGEGRLPSPLNVALNIGAITALAVWLDRRMRFWLGLDGERAYRRIRALVIEAARTEPSTNALIARLENVLHEQTGASRATLMLERHGPDRSSSSPLRPGPGHAALCEKTWVTPESLRRQRLTPGLAELLRFLETENYALLLCVSRGHAKPALILGFGPKTNQSPFTHPEIERLHRVGELIDNILTRSLLQDQEALRAKTEHLAMMSRGLAHDLKNLLTPVSAFLVHTKDNFPAQSVETEVHQAATRSVRIMSDYVREAAFFAEKLSPRFERLTLSAVFDAALKATQSRATARRITVTASAAPDAAFIGDGVLLQRLLANLIFNAIDASSAGAGVALRGTRVDGMVRMEVADEGCGIAREHLARIFDPYFTTKDVGDDVRGFGLGLTICQKIAALHGGTLAVRSELGRGSTFAVEFPGNPVREPGAATPRADELRGAEDTGRACDLATKPA